ncbi:acid phosphatase [Aspergillus sclerotialis]|uniref:Acid phosphatase n=1 Tax=Aspergillus sclerotialis TaxID=2070753 RepID=A0A3A2ZNS7_9EURO|nr:acid phosphatase [Aspergillus sclerotialis]
MHLNLLMGLLPFAHSLNIISSNDDGWAEINIRSLYNSLTSAGHSVVISAPADNQSGAGSLNTPPHKLILPCEFNSCPSGSSAYGHNASQPRFNYVHSHPATSMQYGINEFGPKFFDGEPHLAITGPNVGSNLDVEIFFSGTAGAATYAVKEASIPAIAFSGKSGKHTAWNDHEPLHSRVYAELSTRLTGQLIASGTPYLPPDVWLNVNYPDVSASSCANPDDFHFVLSRMFPAVPLITDDDVETCGSKHLPSERKVVDTSGCYASVSVGMASSKEDANATMQGVVLEKLGSFLTCLPD